ncbi:RepB family DNA primase [Pelagerythrobacter marinus]|nr:RepB family DNA primase [Pelagerythrobacter marinus]
MTRIPPSDGGAKGETLSSRPDEAVEFLEWLRPGGPWILTSIRVDGGGPAIRTKTFDAANREKAESWIQRENADRGVYFMLNPALGPMENKASKEDVAEMAFLHVDIDPRSGEDPVEARSAAKATLHAYSPPPSAIIDSGGGIQALWRLEADEAYIGGSANAAADNEAYNRQLEDDLGGDRCHNCDRILRLPGTINWPNAKKREAGRVTRRASVVELHGDRVYPLSEFEAAPRDKLTSPGKAVEVTVGSEPSPICLDDLPDAVSDRVLMLIVQGENPDDPQKYESRSEVVFAVCRGLVEAGCSDEQIAAVLLDPDLAISESIREKESKRLNYAERQIARAREKKAEDDSSKPDWPMRDLGEAIDWVNERYFAALEGSDYTFFREEADRVQPLSQTGFHFELMTKQVIFEDGSKKAEKRVPVSKLWVSSPRRRVYTRGLTLDPGGDSGRDAYNLWRGFDIEPRPGDWSLMREHIRRVLARGNEAHASYILNWTAWSFQNPGSPPRVAPVFRCGEGIGKGMFASNLVRAFGHHGLHVTSMGQVSGRFNSHLRHCCMLFADEIDAREGKGSGALRGLISERTIPCEGKHKDLVEVPNHIHLLMASNDKWVVPAGTDARRYAVFDVSGEQKGDKAYFDALATQMAEGGLAAMLHDLLEADLSSFHPEADRPETDALSEQRAASLKGFDKVMLDLLSTGELPMLKSTSDRGGGNVFVSTTELKEYAQRWTKRDDISGNAVAARLERLGGEKRDSERPRGWVLPSLDKARSMWDATMCPMPWKACAGWSFPRWSRQPEIGDDGPY